MFCYQCEQTAKGEGCTKIGVCGKQPEVSDLQDLLVYALQGLAQVAVEGRKVGVSDGDVNVFTCEALFSTLTNVNFDEKDFLQLIPKAVALREKLKAKVAAAGGKAEFTGLVANFEFASGRDSLLAQADPVGLKGFAVENPDIQSLRHILLFGLKGIAAYADHAHILGRHDEAVYEFVHEALAALTRKDIGLEEALGLVLKCGEINFKTMEDRKSVV
jgi:hydroxylamine reductase